MLARNGYISKHEWNKQTLKLLENHRFYTDYCKDLLSEKKKKNIKGIKKSLEENKNKGEQQYA